MDFRNARGWPTRHAPAAPHTWVGTLDARIPRDLSGTFHSPTFAMHARCEEVLDAVLVEM